MLFVVVRSFLILNVFAAILIVSTLGHFISVVIVTIVEGEFQIIVRQWLLFDYDRLLICLRSWRSCASRDLHVR
ncbi:hypothetical protein BDZ85DRAFT_268272 [Elsinoe ampelina]|uniref:Uncharacterized protein n=1 Tax=Elsinoe ampelina TaxID=302913 RepID=A0A6A6G209_9PEZI|nr:hypothetical protein BDZ85DRAFT_268272 [Elsinoe ampelina]